MFGREQKEDKKIPLQVWLKEERYREVASVAEWKGMPIASMVRTWIIERLDQEIKR